MYTGFPLRRKITTYYGNGASSQKDDGGLIESFAFGGEAPSNGINFGAYTPGTPVEVKGLKLADDGYAGKRWSLKRAASASSTWGDSDAFYMETPPDMSVRQCGWFTKYCHVTTGGSPYGSGLLDTVTKYTTFPVLGPKATNWATGVYRPKNNHIRLSDGDMDGDVLGFIDTLTRGIKGAVGFLNTHTRLCSSDEWNVDADVSTATLDKCIDSYLPPLFGIPTFGDTWGHPERDVNRLQIFQRTDFAPLVKKLQASAKAGKTAYARVKLNSVANPNSGTPGGVQIDFALFMLSYSAEFANLLPADTQAELAKGQTAGCVDGTADNCGAFSRFPNFNTMGQNSISLQSITNIFKAHGQLAKGLTSLTHPQVRLMSALTTWAVKQHEADVKDVYAKAGA
jgi:hypothetical protein